MSDHAPEHFSRRTWLTAAASIGAGMVLTPFAAADAPAIRGERIMARADHKWMSQQIQEPCILPNPKQPDRLVMFYSGIPTSNRNLCAVGKAWAKVSDPFRWHQDEANPIFSPTGRGWDAASIRLDCVLYIPEEDAYYIYYSAAERRGAHNRIGLAICPAGEDGYSKITPENIVRHGNAPVLEPEPKAPFNETMVSQSAVWREWNKAAKRWDWFLYYSYRGKDGILPGIRLATSTDGKTWTRHFNANDPRGMGQIFKSTPNAYYEWHQILKLGDTYMLSIEVGVNRGARWRQAFAVSKSPAEGWTELDLDTALQTKWTGLYDDRTLYHLATPALYRIGEKWYLYCQACAKPKNNNYIDGEWEMWCVECDRMVPSVPGCAELPVPGVAATPSK